MTPNPPSDTDTAESTAEETALLVVNHSDTTPESPPLPAKANKPKLVLVVSNTSSTPHLLSPRERDVLQLYLDGLEPKKIADQLGITNETLRTHRKHILRKMECHSIGQAIALAYKEGLDYFTR